ncbi:MAG TPA: hypothetical protein VG125_08340 [Pirellulales bacterium]|jgi:hypothetical protein|nr:hypothetical protein [Pirellulales bacterium]
MSRTYHHGKDRHIRVRGIRRPTDLRRLARALVELEYQQAQAEAEAEAEHQREAKTKRKKQRKDDDSSREGAA